MVLATPASARRRPSWLAVGAVAVVGVLAVLGLGRALDVLPDLSNPFGSEQVDRTGPAVLEALQDVSRYEAATGEFQVTVDVEEDARFLPDFVRGERTLFLAQGTVDASVDFTGIEDEAIAIADDGSVTVTLPEATLSEARIDPEESRVLDRDRGVLDRIGGAFSDNPTGERELQILAEQRLEDAAAEAGLRERAQENTERMLQGMLGSLGYDDVRVVFESADER